MEIIFEGTQEVRTSLLGATVIGIIVFSPVFTLSGVEGRIFTPMGIAYLVVVVVSSLESLLVSPALCALLLPHNRMQEREPVVTRFSKATYQPLLQFAMRRSNLVLGFALAMTAASFAIVPTFGREFLPPFQERSLMNAVALYPGSSLEATNRIGMAIQTALKDDPHFESVQLRAGRAPGDPDAASVNLAHLDVELSEAAMRDRPAALKKMRDEFAKLPGVATNVGGFISHRMDEVLSGVRSAIAVKIFGTDLVELRKIGIEVEKAMQPVKGLVDLQLEPQVPIRQVQIQFDRDAAARYGLTIAQLSNLTETALNGRIVSQIPDQQQLVDLLVWVKEDARKNLDAIRNLQVDTPTGQKISLAQVATIGYGTGPNTINRENVSRLIVVSANAAGRDLGSVVEEVQAKVGQIKLPQGYYIQYDGQFEAEQRAAQNLLVFGILAAIAIALLMYVSVKSVPATLMIMLNLPLALVGGIIAVAVTGGIISIPSLIGFVTLFGVATRNGLLLVDSYNTKLAQGMPMSKVIVEGSTERLIAILMTALTSALGVVPLVLGGGAAGKELLQPLAIVVLGGLFTSTALTLLVLPALYARFGKVLMPKSTIVRHPDRTIALS